MKVGIVIPWRSQPSRIPAFEAVIAWYKENLPDAKIYYADHPGPVWLPAATRNDGVRMAEADGVDLVIMNDADTIPEINPLKEAIAAAYRDEMFHNPYTNYRMLEDRGTRQHLVKKLPIEKCSFTPFDSACYGTVVFTPSAWWKIGGMDEKFKQWGYEDTAQQVAHRVINGKDFIKHSGVCYAMGHVPQTRKGQDFLNNKLLYEEYLRADTAEKILELCKKEVLEIPKMPVRILAYVKRYLPETKAGAELMMHQVLLDLRSRGHEVRVVTEVSAPVSIDGVDVMPITTNLNANLGWADVLFTQLDYTKNAMQISQPVKKPLIVFLHNDFHAKAYKINSKNCKMVVANSEWVSETSKDLVNTIVLNPPTDPKKYSGKHGDAITLINMSNDKGGEMFWQLARIFPDKKFIGVRGSYGEQIEYDYNLPNVTIYDSTDDMHSIYSKSGIVIMPSTYESWGRVAVEAMSYGIPVIVSPTPGLEESVGNAGLYAFPTDVAGYVEAIRILEDKTIYNQFSKAGIGRAAELHKTYLEQLDNIENQLINIKRKANN
jgi:glycosyltransferase involved in cell wall biosynthesis